ncbi:MAG TPA: PEP-CTERM sorting domain-containing protein [Acetobacteraceae bacterium]|nr:PEP-CTERM sorting domain-containing protein [Acetobacteraceae bacterium]
MFKLFAASLVITCLATATASADVVYNLQNVGFSDSGITTGTLTINTSGDVSAYDISVSGGDTSSFPAFTYDPTNSSEYAFQASGDKIYTFAQDNSYRQLRLPVATLLSPAGGTYILAANNSYGGECFNCSPYRGLTGGKLVSAPTSVPEPAPLAILGTGLIGLGLLRRRKDA